jgi:ubiquinone/menaquinone biosynthesis C-methylase UbiE
MAKLRAEGIGQKVQRLYTPEYSEGYRASDDAFIAEEYFQLLTSEIRSLTESFGKNLVVLDLGCGTGRYFHALKNTRKLVAMDIAPGMLEMAKHPILEEQITIPDIRLVVGNVLIYPFDKERFDFIYSVGVLGEHSPFDLATANKIASLLNTKGKFYTTIVDSQASPFVDMVKRIAKKVLPFLPHTLSESPFFDRFKTFYMTEKELRAVLDESNFSSYEIARHAIKTARWSGAHFHCTITK